MGVKQLETGTETVVNCQNNNQWFTGTETVLNHTEIALNAEMVFNNQNQNHTEMALNAETVVNNQNHIETALNEEEPKWNKHNHLHLIEDPNKQKCAWMNQVDIRDFSKKWTASPQQRRTKMEQTQMFVFDQDPSKTKHTQTNQVDIAWMNQVDVWDFFPKTNKHRETDREWIGNKEDQPEMLNWQVSTDNPSWPIDAWWHDPTYWCQSQSDPLQHFIMPINMVQHGHHIWTLA